MDKLIVVNITLVNNYDHVFIASMKVHEVIEYNEYRDMELYKESKAAYHGVINGKKIIYEIEPIKTYIDNNKSVPHYPSYRYRRVGFISNVSNPSIGIELKKLFNDVRELYSPSTMGIIDRLKLLFKTYEPTEYKLTYRD